MNDIPDTRESLLIRVRDPEDREAWERFVEIYQPIVFRLARRRGLQSADAEDLCQRVLLSISTAIADWKPHSDKVPLSELLLRIAKTLL